MPGDVLERPYTVGGGGGTPPPLPFQCSRLTAKILLWRLRRQEDLSVKTFGLPSAGAMGGPKEEGVSQPDPPPPPPSNTSLGMPMPHSACLQMNEVIPTRRRPISVAGTCSPFDECWPFTYERSSVEAIPLISLLS